MEINKEQAEILVRLAIAAAEAVQHDEEYKHSDYGGMAVFRFTEDEAIKKFMDEFNLARTV